MIRADRSLAVVALLSVAYQELFSAKQWHVGDADGLDALVKEYNPTSANHFNRFKSLTDF